MSKKIFSLIYGNPQKVTPNQKIIPADDCALILSAEEVLEKVKQDAETYRLDVTKECEKLKSLAVQEGFTEGYQKWAEQIAKIEEEIIRVRQELEKMLVPVALKAAKKIVGRELELSDTAIVDIVSNVLKTVSQHKKVTIYVNKKDLDALEASRPRLKDIFESLEALSLRERDDIERGGCVVETEIGIINAKLENQWSALERAFQTLMKQKEETPIPAKAEKS